jgi:DNA-binding NarL/FixJ family response regulator
MSNPRKPNSRAGAQRTNKYAYTLTNSVHLIRASTSTRQETRSSTNESAVSPPHTKHMDELYQRWLSLSAREQDVVALTCLGNKNQQIAFRLGLSLATVKSYLQTVFYKLNLHSKTELRLQFYGWDFSKWE